ncbi:penicillin-binding transpeptidase domain-containing protein [Salicibibacter cibarius]|uniref:penicillin-binding transpeptidase domain-containing protein n=1 Tax=Salicibibacter cibarius TaxID=2743000 RepID=UPI003CCD2908
MLEEQALITSDEAEAARAIDIEDQLDFTPANNDFAYQSFVDHVMEEVESIDGVETIDLYAAGFDIYTTIEPDAQQYAEAVIQSDEYIHQYPDEEHFQVGFTLLDTQTGAIRAIVGNRQENEAERGWNHATAASGQPGSTVKPLLDYGPAIDQLQWSTGEQIVDAPHEYSDGTTITNYSGNYSGSVSMREALVRSLNIPAVKAMQEVGLENAQSFAEGLGLSFENNIEESYALGGFQEGVSSLDMAGAYAAFGNGGRYNEPHSVRKIVFRDGQEIDLNPESERAMNDYTAYMISDMLKGVVTDSAGTGRRANVDGLPLAGKTGTSNFSQEERDRFGVPDGGVPDIWFNGYTTRYTAAVWTGYGDGRGSGYLAAGEEQQIARDIFRHIMTHVHAGEGTEDFPRPDSVCGDSELFVCGAEPTTPRQDDSSDRDSEQPEEENDVDDPLEEDTEEDIPDEPIEEAPDDDSVDEPIEEEEATDDSTEEEETEEESTEEEPAEEETDVPTEETPEDEAPEEPTEEEPEDDPNDSGENNGNDGDNGDGDEDADGEDAGNDENDEGDDTED